MQIRYLAEQDASDSRRRFEQSSIAMRTPVVDNGGAITVPSCDVKYSYWSGHSVTREIDKRKYVQSIKDQTQRK